MLPAAISGIKKRKHSLEGKEKNLDGDGVETRPGEILVTQATCARMEEELVVPMAAVQR